MPWYRIRGGGVCHIKMDKGRAPKPCRYCGCISDRLCDRILPMPFIKHGKRLTCDAPICEHCSWSPEPGKDLCPPCVIRYRGWLVDAGIPIC